MQPVPETKKNFAQRHLQPADRLAESLCGLIMVLTFTLAAGLTVATGEHAGRDLLIAAIGCNLAWGIIDGILYIMSALTIRSDRARLIKAIQQAPDENAALDIIRRKLGKGIGALAPPDESERLYRSIFTYLSQATGAKSRITRDDVMGAVAIFWLEVITCLPAAVPFLFIRDPQIALRVSNAILITLMFMVGYEWARHVNTSRWIAGLATATVGLVLVGVAMLLGG